VSTIPRAVGPRSLPIGPGRGDLDVDYHWQDPTDPEPWRLPEAALRAGGPDVRICLLVPAVGSDRDLSIVAPWLSEIERERAAHIQHPRALAEFLAGRRLLRGIVAPLIGVAPQDLHLVENPQGALALDPTVHQNAWHFNISHTEGLVALAIARAPVGVDVEWTARPGRTVELAERYFAPSEVLALRALPAAEQRERFFDLWTLKEAYIKARGKGLAIPLHTFSFTLTERSIAIMLALPSARAFAEGCRFQTVRIGPAHRLALALLPDGEPLDAALPRCDIAAAVMGSRPP